MSFIWQYLKLYKKELLIFFISMLSFSVVMIGQPTLVAYIIDHVLAPRNLNALLWPIILMIGLALLSLTGQVIGSYYLSKIVNDITMVIRNDVYTKMQHLSHHEFQMLGVPSLTTRITTDAFIVLQFLQVMLRILSVAPFMIVGSIVMISRISPALGAYVLPVAPFVVLLVILIAKVTLPISEKQQTTLDAINRVLRENILGNRVVRAFNREEFMAERFEAVSGLYRDYSKKLFKTMALMPSLFSFAINIAIIMLVWVGSTFVYDGRIQVGDLYAFVEYVFQILFSLMIFGNIFMMYPKATVSANRLKEVMDTPISVKNASDPIMETDGRGHLTFEHVDFIYPDAHEPVLKNINFSSKAGETVAFIGSTGSGKSTVIKLIPRFYDVSKGRILLDGVDIRDLDIDVLRSKIGFTPQKTNLFTGDIAWNLRYGNEKAEEPEMEHATDVSQAKEFIDRLESKFKTHLAEGGSNLSGGQKQRLSIARSIIGDREIYVFDDSFSALDYKTDIEVRRALKEETKNATTIIVAQRVGTIMHADQILVLEKGEIVAQGKHEELLKNSPLYYDIATSQLSRKELGLDEEE